MSKASVYFKVRGIKGTHGVKELKRELNSFHGVISVSVNDNADNIAVDFDTTGLNQEQLKTKIEKMGYDITQMKFENHIM